MFKFEKGFVRPKLSLWLKMTEDCEIPEKKAVLIWIRANLPEAYRPFIDLAETPPDRPIQPSFDVYAGIDDRKELRQRLTKDRALPKGFRALAADDDFWATFQPTGQEVKEVLDKFGGCTNAAKPLFLEAFRLIRECT